MSDEKVFNFLNNIKINKNIQGYKYIIYRCNERETEWLFGIITTNNSPMVNKLYTW